MPDEFWPHPAADLAARIRHIENFLSNSSIRRPGVGGVSTVGSSIAATTAGAGGTSGGDTMATNPDPSQLEDSAHTSGDRGVLALTIRNDTGGPAGLAGLDGDYQGLQTDQFGRLPVADFRVRFQLQSIELLLMEILDTLKGGT